MKQVMEDKIEKELITMKVFRIEDKKFRTIRVEEI